MTDIFPDIPMAKINRINLQRQEPGKRGPGTLVYGGLPPYTDADELMGLCEDLGAGKYKAIALCERGKPLGPAWAFEVAGAVEEVVLPREPDSRRSPESAQDDDLRELRAAHRDELNELRRHLESRHEEELEREREHSEQRADTRVEMAEMDAERRVRAAERREEESERRASQELQRAGDELERAQMRMERLQNELDSRVADLLSTTERLSQLDKARLEDRLRFSERITELEGELRAQTRIHEADLRELRNGSPESTAALARANTEWEIEKSKIMLTAELQERARERGLSAQLAKALESESIQAVLFPMLNDILERVLAPPEKN